MRESKNVFNLWLENDKKLPFFVRADHWSKYSKFEITKIEPKWDYYKETGNMYGKAFGYYYNNGIKKEYTQLPNAGVYKWAIVKQ